MEDVQEAAIASPAGGHYSQTCGAARSDALSRGDGRGACKVQSLWAIGDERVRREVRTYFRSRIVLSSGISRGADGTADLSLTGGYLRLLRRTRVDCRDGWPGPLHPSRVAIQGEWILDAAIEVLCVCVQ